jgi:hypothetical protein
MGRILLLLALLAPLPLLAQGAPASTTSTAGTTTAAEEAPVDPVAAWEADRTVILDAAEADLEAFEYVARPLVVFADSPRQPQFVEQLRLIEAAVGDLAERDVVVIVDTDPEARSEVRRALRPRGFGLVLVDKDGRVTLRQPAPTAVREVTRAIDRTPIRQEELRTGRTTAGSE